jgi:lysophospholipase L1-like esterase
MTHMSKRWTIAALTLSLVLSLAACGPAQDTTDTDSAGEENTTNQTGESNPPEDTQTNQENQDGQNGEESPAETDNVSVSESDPVDASWFDDAAFVGDSVSVTLANYNSSYGVLGNAKFFCSVSLSQTNALSYQTGNAHLPEYPAGSGQHPRIEDGIAASGAKKVYLMLGMNCIASGVDRVSQDLVTLVSKIQEKSPGIAVLIESVTPMTADSPRADGSLNNYTIQEFNEKMKAICQEKQWYYVNVAEAVTGDYGALKAEYSGDKAMGIHFNYDGAAAWANYLLTHVPDALK